MLQQEPICALATASGVGAIGVIRVSGEGTFEVVNQIFKGKDLRKVETHTLHFGTIRDGETIVDEVLVAVFKSPKSFTKEDTVEISCHGSDYIIRQILKLLVRAGAAFGGPESLPNGHFSTVSLIWCRPKPLPTSLRRFGGEPPHGVESIAGRFFQEINLTSRRIDSLCLHGRTRTGFRRRRCGVCQS